MKKLLYLLFFFNQLGFCQNDSKTEKDSIKTIFGNVSKSDTFCLNEIEKAKKDIENGIIINYMPTYNGLKCNDINLFHQLLLKDNIKTERSTSFCVGNEKKDCYGYYMTQYIEDKFGKDYIYKVARKADSIFVTQNPDKVYDGLDYFDKTPFYPNARSYKSQYDDYKYDFFNKFIYPKNFKYKSGDSHSHTNVFFILNKNGSISDVSIKTKFQDKENEGLEKYFEERILKFVKEVKWIPRKKYNIGVNSEVSLTFFYK